MTTVLSHGKTEINEALEKVKAPDLQYMKDIVPQSILNLDRALQYRFVIDPVTVNLLEQLRNGLDLTNKRDELNKKLTEAGDDTSSPRPDVSILGTYLPKGLNGKISEIQAGIIVLESSITGLEADIATQSLIVNDSSRSKDDRNNASREIQRFQAEIGSVRTRVSNLKSLQTKYQEEAKQITEQKDKVNDFMSVYQTLIGNAGGTTAGTLTNRINKIITLANQYVFTNNIDRTISQLGNAPTTPAYPIDLQSIFFGMTIPANPVSYTLADAETGSPLPVDNGKIKCKTESGAAIELSGVSINGNQIVVDPTRHISITPTQGIEFPVNLRLSIRGRMQESSTGINVDAYKNFDLTLNEPNRDIGRRHTTVDTVEGNLSAEYLKTRLRQDYENKFNKLQREAFEKVLMDNPEFAKLNQAQKDRLYERMQDLGTIANPVAPINLGKPVAGPDVTYPVDAITFAPSTHTYSVMPHGEDYDGFKVWLANQAPKDVINDEEKYRSWMRNGLAASLDNGKTHYESFFDDVLKQFTEDLNVKTTLNKTLLDFINDTNTADHVGFAADLAANLNATEPMTTYTKKWYQKLAFWTRGEPQNYLSFFSGQSHEFTNESITAGGKTFGYTGKLDIKSSESMSLTLKMKDAQEQIYKGGNPVALIRTLLDSPDIEPPHARFHAGLSVVKSVTKLARDNGISLRTALTPEMLATLPIGIRTTIENGENPMVEVEEVNGKLVAKVFNLNLVTRRKENEYKLFDEQDFVATQSVRDLRQGVEGLLAITNQTMNNVYAQYKEGRSRSRLRPGLLKKPKYGGLRNMYKKLSFTGESVSVGGKSFNLDCKDGLFTFTGGDLKKPVSGRNLGDLLAYNPSFRGVELRAMHIANEKMLGMYQEKLKTQKRHHNYGVIDEENHRVYIYDKDGNLGYYESDDQTFVQRWRQYTSGHRYGRIADANMPTGFRVMKQGDRVVEKESYDNFLRNETLVGSMVRAMSRTHRALIAMDPW